MSEPTRSKYAVLTQVCQLIPPHLTGKLAREHGVDKKARTFSPWSHVVVLLFAQLIHASSLHHVCDALRTHAAKLLTVRLATPPAKNTLYHANRNRDAAMGEDLFWAVLKHLHSRPIASPREAMGRLRTEFGKMTGNLLTGRSAMW